MQSTITETENPTQPNNQRAKTQKNRLLTKQFRSIQHDIRSQGDDLADPTKTDLQDKLSELNGLAHQVERPSEQADDAEAFEQLCSKGFEMSRRVAAGKGRTVGDFLRHLKAMFVTGENAQEDGEELPNAFRWEHLGRETAGYFYQVAGASCLLGPLDQLPKAKKQIQRQARKPVGKAVAPTELTSEDPQAKEKRETEKNMEVMQRILKQRPEGIGYLELTMNNRSFAQFAENCFSLSFLIKNKHARMARSESSNEKGIMIYPIKQVAGQEKDKTDSAKDTAQLIVAFTMQDWNEWKKYVRDDDCVMPHRIEGEDEAEAQATQLEADVQTNAGEPSRKASSSILVDDSDDDEEDVTPIGSRKRKSSAGTQNGSAGNAKARHRLSRAS